MNRRELLRGIGGLGLAAIMPWRGHGSATHEITKPSFLLADDFEIEVELASEAASQIGDMFSVLEPDLDAISYESFDAWRMMKVMEEGALRFREWYAEHIEELLADA